MIIIIVTSNTDDWMISGKYLNVYTIVLVNKSSVCHGCQIYWIFLCAVLLAFAAMLFHQLGNYQLN